MGQPKLPFVDVENVVPKTLDELSGDNTIGYLYGESDIEGQAAIDVRRLQVALMAFQDAFDDRVAHIGVAELGSEEAADYAFVLKPSDASAEAIVVALRHNPEWDGMLSGCERALDNGTGDAVSGDEAEGGDD